MYTWGYIKENCLRKLNITEEDANQLGFLSNFPFYANEAMTQICSIKPKEVTIVVKVTKNNEVVKFPEDFIAIDDSPIYFAETTNAPYTRVSDNVVKYHNYREVVCKNKGTYYIPYKARWLFFDPNMDNNFVLDMPDDICEAIPSYVVSQCLKIDDELKSNTYRNEFEMFLARLDDTTYRDSRDIEIDGGW